MVPAGQGRIRFGAFEVDLQSGELFRGETRVTLQKRPFQILALLLRSSGHTVSREQIYEQAWSDESIDRRACLNGAICELRAALDDDPFTPRMIETVDSRGYRFLPPVEGFPSQHPSSPAADQVRLAIFPFQCMCDSFGDCCCSGLTEQLIAQLGRMCHHIAVVVSPQSQDSLMFPLQAGRKLNCEFVLCGGVFRSGNRYRVSARLLQVEDGLCRWSESYSRNEADIFWIQEEITLQIAHAISDTLPAAAKQNPHLVTNPATYRKFLEAVYLMNTMAEPAFQKAVALFQEVINHDPEFAPAYASSAIIHAFAGQYGPFFPDVVYAKVNEQASRALELAPELPEAHVAVGMAHLFHQADFEGAEAYFSCALDLNPSNVLANQLYSQVCTVLCRHSEAISAMHHAQELDPLSPIVGTLVACAYFFSGQLESAREHIDRTLALWPECASTLATAGWVLTELGDHDLALERYHQALDVEPRSTLMMANLAFGLAAAGCSREALRLLRRVIEARREVWVSSYWIALVYSRLRLDEKALNWFNQAKTEHDGWRILSKTDPRFRPPSAQQVHLVSFYDVISQ